MNNQRIAVALFTNKDLSPFYEGLFPLLQGLNRKHSLTLVKSPRKKIRFLDGKEFQVISLDWEQLEQIWNRIDILLTFDWNTLLPVPAHVKVISLTHFLDMSDYPDLLRTYGRNADYHFMIRTCSRRGERKKRRYIEEVLAHSYPPEMMKIKETCIIPGGYPELDGIQKFCEKNPPGGKTILFAVTGLSIGDRLLVDYGEEVLSILLERFPEHKIIFRPSPGDRGSPVIQNILTSFQDHERFFYNDSEALKEVIAESQVLVTDSTGLKEVFSLATGRPYRIYT